jgi:outer membrane protein assembly factor BamE
MKKITLILPILILSACSSSPYIPNLPDFSDTISSISEVLAPEIYKKDINQGSVLRVEKYNEIKLGMTQDEVIMLIGTPSIDDVFHKNQWEYIHHSILKNNEVLSFRITLLFDEGKLIDISKTDDANLTLIEKRNINFDDSDISDSETKDNSDWFKFW